MQHGLKNKKYDNLPLQDKERFAHICPHFIIELRSQSDTLKQQKEKMDEWMANGCCLGWLIDLENKNNLHL